MNTYAVRTVEIKTGAALSLLGNISAASEAAAIERAAVLMGFDDAADMLADYGSNTYKPQTVTATATSAPASHS